MTEQVGWGLIPPYIMANEELSANEKLVFGRIMGLSGKNGYCWASNFWLGKQIAIDEGTVANIISSLKKKGLIETKVFRDDQAHITKRHIFVRNFTGQLTPLHGIMNTSSSDNDSYSVESSVENTVYNRQPAKTEQHTNKEENYWLVKRAKKESKRRKPFGSPYTPKPFVQYEKKKKVYVDGRGVI